GSRGEHAARAFGRRAAARGDRAGAGRRAEARAGRRADGQPGSGERAPGSRIVPKGNEGARRGGHSRHPFGTGGRRLRPPLPALPRRANGPRLTSRVCGNELCWMALMPDPARVLVAATPETDEKIRECLPEHELTFVRTMHQAV